MRLSVAVGVVALAVGAAAFQEEPWEGRGVLLQMVVRGPHANATRPKWEALERQFAGSREVWVGRLFCDAPPDGEARCAALLDGRHVGAFPSVFFGDPRAVEEHVGAKTSAALAAVAAGVSAPCSPRRRDRCDAAQTALLEGCEAMAARDLDELVANTEIARAATVDSAEAELTARRERLLDEWEALETVFVNRVGRAAATLQTLYAVAKARGALPPPTTWADDFDDEAGSYGGDGLAGLPDDYYDDDDAYDDEYYYDDQGEYDDAYASDAYYRSDSEVFYDDEADADAYYAYYAEERRRSDPRRR